MIKYRRNQRIGIQFLKQVEFFILISKDPVLHIVRLKDGRKYLIQRFGECKSKQCNSLCCKFIHSNNWTYGNFGKKTEFGRQIDITCNYLSKDGKCKVWKKKEFDAPCRYFPVADDKTYWAVIKECTFRFEIIEEIKIEKNPHLPKEYAKKLEKKNAR